MIKLLLLLFTTVIFSQEEYLVSIPATSYTEWVYFSLETNDIVLIDYPESSLEWDLAFQRKHIKTNSGLSGPGNGGAYVDSVGNLDSGSFTWLDEWENLNNFPEYGVWLEDTTQYDFYDLQTHTMVEGIKNPALNSWGWFNESYQLVPTNYVMFVKSADGNKILKFWAYDYYNNNFGGNISIRYQIIEDLSNECNNSSGDVNNDGILNIIDVVTIVSFVTTSNEDSELLCGADFNSDGIINIIDIVSIVSEIIN
ncbi:MAG: hypothetical protein CMD06_06315 [Flavobacteriales bacterium]|nr:hypothetical protein [Flavobacteriales bacterium]